MASRSGGTSNVLAGGFLLAGVILAIIISFVLSRATESLQTMNRYTVVFPVATGAAGLKPGSEVLLGGQKVGRVSDIPLDLKTQPLTHISVKIKVERDLVIYKDAVIHLERPLLGSLSAINIASLGNEPPGNVEVLRPGESIEAKILPPALLAQSGYGAAQAEDVKQIITMTRRTVGRLDKIVGDNEQNVSAALEQAATLVREINEHLPRWSRDVDRVLANVSTGTDDVPGLVSGVRGMVDENRENVKRVIADAAQITDRINGISIEELEKTLKQAQVTLESFTTAAADTTAIIKEEAPNLRKTMDNARLASDQLKLALVEIRSQPWRLFYTPKLKETETSVLYDVARSYAYAVSDLRAASESLESAVSLASTPGGERAIDPAELQRITAHVKEAFEKYKTAETRLLDRLIFWNTGSAVPPPDASRGTGRVEEGKSGLEERK